MKGTVKKIARTTGGTIVQMTRTEPPPPEEVEIINPVDWAYDLFLAALAGDLPVDWTQDEADNVVSVTVG